MKFYKTYRLIWIRDIYCWHVEPCFVESWSLAKFLNNLHHDSLSVRLVTGLVSLAQVEPHPLRMFGRDLLHDVQCSLAQSLTNGVEEDKDQVTEIREPENGFIDIKWIAHVSIHKSWSVYKGDQGELLLLGRGDLGGQIVHQVGHGGQGLEVWVQVEGGVTGQRFSLLPGCYKGESLGLYGHSGSLDVLLYIPVYEGGLASRMITYKTSL